VDKDPGQYNMRLKFPGKRGLGGVRGKTEKQTGERKRFPRGARKKGKKSTGETGCDAGVDAYKAKTIK